MGYLDNAGLGVLWKNIVGKSIPYGYCTTAAGTRAKTVTVSPAITELTAGVQILVKFQYANTASTTSSPVTLNVNGLGAKDIKRYGSTNISNSATTSWNANSVVLLTYDGTYWQLTDYNNTTYSGMTDAEVNAGTSGTNRLITPARLKYAIQHWSTGEANVQSDWNQTDDTADDYIKNKPSIPSGVSPYTSNPSMDGTASAGSSNLFSRGDHVHPSDTSRVPTTRKVNGKALSSDITLYGTDIAVDSTLTGLSVTTAIGNVSEELENKVDKADGKGLSTNDYTTEEKEKLAGIIDGANTVLNVGEITEPVEGHNINGTYKKDGATSSISWYDASFIDGMFGSALALLSNKVDKVTGKGLSTNDYTTAEKDKLAGIAAGAEANVNADWNATSGDAQILNKPTIPSKTSDLTNDSGFITGYTETDPAFTASPAYGITAQNITSWNNKVNKSGDIGLGDMMFQTGSGIGLKFQGDNADKVVRLNGFGGAAGYNLYFRGFDVGASGNNPVSLLNIADPTSEQGAATKKYVDDNKFSGSYNDLTNKPTIPTKTSDLTNDSGFSTFSGSYNDLTNKPTIPTKTSDLTNDSGFLTTYNAISSENGIKGNTFLLSVNGSTAGLYFQSGGSVSFYVLVDAFQSIAGVTIAQVIGGTSEAPTARVYEIAELDASNFKVRLVSVDDGVVYTADLQASDYFSALTGTFSSQTIPTGGITTETDPTVPAWAKASSKPSYGADEISFDNTQQTQYLGSATDVNTALTSLDYALDNAEHDINNISSDYFSKSGGTIKGDVTLYVASGNSPGLIFQRGTLTDNYNDWKIYDKSGFLYFAQRGSGSSSFGDMGYIDTTGVLHFNIAWGSVTGKPTIPSKTSDLTNDSGFITGVQAPDVVFATQGSNYLDNESEVDGALNALDSAVGDKVDRFKVTLSYNSSTQEYSVDKTYAEIESAVSANKYVYIYDATETVSSQLGQAHFVIVAPLTLASPQDYWYEFWANISDDNGTRKVRYSIADDGVYVDSSLIPTQGLPWVGSSDNGKVLRVVNGAWSAVALPSASGVSF